MKTSKYGICPVCGASCGLIVDVENGKIAAITGDKKDPHSLGYTCPKGRSLKNQHEDPDRVLFPMKRSGDAWKEVTWHSAMDDIARRIADIKRRCGKEAVALYAGDGATRSFETLLAIAAFIIALDVKNLFTANSMDALPRLLASNLVFGKSALLPIPDVERTDYFLVIGANPVVSNGSVMTAPGFSRHIRGIQKRGGKVVVVDPRRNETAEMADEHFFIRPETDAMFLLALINVIFEERLDKPGAMRKSLKGYAKLKMTAREFTPGRVESATAVPESEIRRIAREFSSAPSAVCYGRMGTCAQSFGTTASALIDILNTITGNLDRPGGAMFTTPAVDMSLLMSSFGITGTLGRNRTRVSGLPDFNGEMPCAALAEEIEAPNGIRALIVVGGNPAVSVPNTNRLTRALPKLALMAVLDPHINATSRYAHYVLPPAIGLEHDTYPMISYATAIHNVAKYAPRVIEPPSSVKYDAEILGELICRVLGHQAGAPRLVGESLMRIGKRIEGKDVLKLLIALGPYGRLAGVSNPGRKTLTLEDIMNNPSGMLLGPLQPGLRKMLGPFGSVNLVPKVLSDEIPRIREFMEKQPRISETPDRDTLILINRRQLRFVNTSLHNVESLAAGQDKCVLQMNPKDAAARGIKTGDTVIIESETGSAETKVEVTADIIAGAVSMPFGWNGPQPKARQIILNKHPGTNVNTVTDESRIDPVSAMTAFNGTRLRVSKKQHQT